MKPAPLGAILEAGEWKSKAMQVYLDETGSDEAGVGMPGICLLPWPCRDPLWCHPTCVCTAPPAVSTLRVPGGDTGCVWQ